MLLGKTRSFQKARQITGLIGCVFCIEKTFSTACFNAEVKLSRGWLTQDYLRTSSPASSAAPSAPVYCGIGTT